MNTGEMTQSMLTDTQVKEDEEIRFGMLQLPPP